MTRTRASTRLATAAPPAPARAVDMEDLAPPPTSPPDAVDQADAPSLSLAMRHDAAFHDFDMKELRAVRHDLLLWYDAYRRKLPWRGDPPPYLTTATHTKQKAEGSKTAKARGNMMDAFLSVKEEEEEDVEQEPEAQAQAQIEPPRKVAPYETWVSEIMLQQTRVDTVVEYFTRWIDKFPTVAALAEASEEDVNALWAGLGYYRRARMLHAGAKYVMEHLGGEMPSTVEGLLAIPGIGPYTAGAIASIAYGHRAPLVDGNVIRVMARLRAVGADPKNKELIKFSWKSAGELVEECDRPGALNQAIMELGATICTVQNPQCAQCPVRGSCLAYEEAQTTKPRSSSAVKTGVASPDCSICDLSRLSEWDTSTREVAKYPLKAKKNESKNEVICVSVVSCPGDADSPDDSASWRFLMSRRPKGGLLAGQWEFLHSKVADGDKIPPFSRRKQLMTPRLESLLSKRVVTGALVRRDLGELTHVFSHVKHHMGVEHVHLASCPSRDFDTDDANADQPVQWMTTDEMDARGITTGVKKVLQLVLKPDVTPKAAGRKKNSTSSKRGAAHVADGAKRAKTIVSFFTKL